MRNSSALKSYAVATLLCVACLAVRLLLDYVVTLQRPLVMIFLIPVVLSSYFGGWWIGVYATLLSSVLVAAGVLKNFGTIPEVMYLSIFVVLGLLISAICERLIRSRHAAEADRLSLKQSEERLKLALDAARVRDEQLRLVMSSDSMGILDYDILTGRLFLSEGLRRMVGISADEPYGIEQWLSHFNPEDRDFSLAHLGQSQTPDGGGDYSARRRLVRPDGSHIWIDCRGKTLFQEREGKRIAVRSVFMIQDITRQIEHEKAEAQSKRLDALGGLTSGIAHNFNNILTVITGNLQLMQMRPADGKSEVYLSEALKAAEMGGRLNRRLITFARRGELEVVPVHLNGLVQMLAGLLSPALGEPVEITCNLAAAPDLVMVDRAELEATIMNFIMNAKDAMGTDGRLEISTRNRSISAAEEWAGGTLMPGDYIEVRVSDTGHGMDEATLSRAMEPFFTTKPAEKGSGLGLATAFGFAVQSGGMLKLESKEGAGTHASLLLPSTEAAGGAADAPDLRDQAVPRMLRPVSAVRSAAVRSS